MSDYLGYPNLEGAPLDGDYVTSEVDADLINSKLLTPGPGIAITITGADIIVTNTGSGGGGANPALTYFTKANETAGLPNSYQVSVQSPIVMTYGTNTVQFSFITGTNTQVLTQQSGAAVWDWAGEVGSNTITGGGTVTLSATSLAAQMIDCTAGPTTVQLPAASSCPNKTFCLKKVDGTNSSVTITPNGVDEIDGLTAAFLFIENQAITIRSIGGDWEII